jgi:hypothetical protein
VRNPFAKAEVRWNAWNLDHCGNHGMEPRDVEYVIRNPDSKYPKRMGRKYLVRGRLPGGMKAQVVFIKDDALVLRVYPIHAMPLR